MRAGQICYREEDLASDADVAFEVETRGGSECLFVFAHRHDHETLVLTQTRTGGDEVTTDNVLLEAFERIDLTVDSSIVEDLRRFLEGSSRHKALRLQSGAGDPLEDLTSRRGLSFADLYGTQVTTLQLAVLITQLAERDDLPWAEGLGVASVDDDDLTPEAVVLIHDLKLIDDLLLEEERIPWIEDLYLAHHPAGGRRPGLR